MNEPVLDVRNLQVKFKSDNKEIVAVDDISFVIQQGQVLGIVGESGSGKSITSLAVIGLIPSPGKITNGEIWFRTFDNTKPVNLLSLDENARRDYRGGEIAMIFQEPMSSLNPVYTIGFQITEAIRLHQRVSPQQADRQAIALLQEVKLLPSDQQFAEQYKEKIQYNPQQGSPNLNQEIEAYIEQQKQAMLKRYPHELSGGQLQRVMIAMAISCDPSLLIADEPTTALDVTVQATILKLLRDLCKNRNMTMMFISHDLGVIANIADAVAVMYRGKIVEAGKVEQILSEPQHPYTKGLLACRPDINKLVKKLATVSDYMEEEEESESLTGEIKIQPKEPLILTAISQEEEHKKLIKEQNKRLERLEKQEDILFVDNLKVYFPVKGIFGKNKDVFKAVDGVSFIVKRGETLGLVGESGCGKSTLARTILRLIAATEGTIKFRSNDSGWEDISKMSMADKRLRRLRQNMQIIFQNPYNSLNPRLTIGQAIMEPMIIHKPKELANQKQKRERVREVLKQVKLEPTWENRYPHQLSGGQRQRVCIARAIVLKPKFIICDESVSALDVSVQAKVLNLLKDLQKEMDLTYIFISHDLSVVKFMSDRIMVMNRGKIEEKGTANQIINNPQKDYTQRLIDSIPKFPQEYL